MLLYALFFSYRHPLEFTIHRYLIHQHRMLSGRLYTERMLLFRIFSDRHFSSACIEYAVTKMHQWEINKKNENVRWYAHRMLCNWSGCYFQEEEQPSGSKFEQFYIVLFSLQGVKKLNYVIFTAMSKIETNIRRKNWTFFLFFRFTLK